MSSADINSYDPSISSSIVYAGFGTSVDKKCPPVLLKTIARTITVGSRYYPPKP